MHWRGHSDQMVLKMIRRGRLVLFSWGQESQNWLKEDYHARVHSDQMVLMIVRREVGQCQQRLIQGLHSLRMFIWELENNSRQPSNLEAIGKWQPKEKSLFTLSPVRFLWWGIWCRWKWWWFVKANQTDYKSMWQCFWVLMKQGSGIRLNRWPCLPEWEVGVNSHPHTSHVIGNRWSMRTHNRSQRKFTPPCLLFLWTGFLMMLML